MKRVTHSDQLQALPEGSIVIIDGDLNGLHVIRSYMKTPNSNDKEWIECELPGYHKRYYYSSKKLANCRHATYIVRTGYTHANNHDRPLTNSVNVLTPTSISRYVSGSWLNEHIDDIPEGTIIRRAISGYKNFHKKAGAIWVQPMLLNISTKTLPNHSFIVCEAPGLTVDLATRPAHDDRVVSAVDAYALPIGAVIAADGCPSFSITIDDVSLYKYYKSLNEYIAEAAEINSSSHNVPVYTMYYPNMPLNTTPTT